MSSNISSPSSSSLSSNVGLQATPAQASSSNPAQAPSSNDSPAQASLSAPPAEASSSTANFPQRTSIHKNWTKDSKTKTCKCKVCGDRVTKFSHQCDNCSNRICSDCTEADGANSDQHKAIARDYIDNGCWCGFPYRFNPAFKDRLPAPKMRGSGAKKAPARGGKKTGSRKSKKESSPSPTPPEKDVTTAEENTATPEGQSESSEDPFKTNTPQQTGSYFYVPAPQQDASLPSSKYSGNDDLVTSSPADQTKTPTRKKRKASKPAQDAPVEGSSPADAAEESPAKRRKISAETVSSNTSSLTELTSEKSENGDDDSSGDNITLATAPATQAADSALPTSRPTRSTRTTRAAAAASSSKTKIKKEPSSSDTTLPKPALADHIVIIGAGVIGMFTALKLAQKNAADGKKQKITVVDINEEPCMLASNHSAGFLTTRDMRASHDELMTVAINDWNALTEDFEFRKAVRFNGAVFAPTKDETSPTTASVPWFLPTDNEAMIDNGTSLGMINPICLAKWLYRQSTALGVQYRCSWHPTYIKRSPAGATSGVVIQHATNPKVKPETIPCCGLVLAAGPFTPDLFNRLFNWSNVTQPSGPLQHAQWVRFEQTGITVGGTQGVSVPEGEGEGEVPFSLIARPGRGGMVIASAAFPLANPRRPLRNYDALAHPGRSGVALRQLAARRIGATHDLTAQGTGVTQSCWVSDRAVMGEVAVESARGVKVWVCYGWGMLGTTLAPGVGKVMAGMIRGEESEVDLGVLVGVGGVKGGKGECKSKTRA